MKAADTCKLSGLASQMVGAEEGVLRGRNEQWRCESDCQRSQRDSRWMTTVRSAEKAEKRTAESIGLWRELNTCFHF